MLTHITQYWRVMTLNTNCINVLLDPPLLSQTQMLDSGLTLQNYDLDVPIAIR